MTEQFMKMGASDRFFFYALTGRSTLNPRLELTFREDFDLAAMKEAADEALGYIPEFNKHIVVRNGRPEAVVGSGDTAFIPDAQNRNIAFGTAETNGLLFYFGYSGKILTLSVFHGLTDGAGMTAFMRTVMYLYIRKKGIALTAEEEAEMTAAIRTEKGIPAGADEDDLFTPYEKHGDPAAETQWSYTNPGAFAIPETPYSSDCAFAHVCRIVLPLAEVKAEQQKLGTSMLPMLTDIVSAAVAKTFGSGDRPLVVMSAIDQRRCFGSKTLVNCSDSLFFTYDAELAEKDVRERCAELKAAMKQQLDPGNHKKMAGMKVLTVREFEKDPAGVAEFARRLADMPPADNFNPMTCVLTVIGEMSLGRAADRLLEGLDSYMVSRGACFAGVSAFGGKMLITAVNQSDSRDFAEGITAELNKRGLHAELISDSRMNIDGFTYDESEEKQ